MVYVVLPMLSRLWRQATHHTWVYVVLPLLSRLWRQADLHWRLTWSWFTILHVFVEQMMLHEFVFTQTRKNLQPHQTIIINIRYLTSFSCAFVLSKNNKALDELVAIRWQPWRAYLLKTTQISYIEIVGPEIYPGRIGATPCALVATVHCSKSNTIVGQECICGAVPRIQTFTMKKFATCVTGKKRCHRLLGSSCSRSLISGKPVTCKRF